MKGIEEYYEILHDIYGDTPVLCITPIWRGDVENGEPTLISFCNKLKAICEKYSNITIVDGFKLVPHLEEYFLDKSVVEDCYPNRDFHDLYIASIEKVLIAE